MTASELRDIILSADFKTGLEEVSSYLASIMQEAPIVHLFARYLWRQKRLYALERYKRHDLTVWTPGLPTGEKETTVEFKFNYETCSNKLRKELRSLGDKLPGNPTAFAAKGSNWQVIPRILKDFRTKDPPDVFVWIICSRDLGQLGGNLQRIANSKPLKKYREHHPYKTDREFLVTIDGFLELLKEYRPFSVSTAEVETNGTFPSIYHFRICEFTRSGGLG
jgi:hypothetical protein